jgi:hypothetical protein
LEKDELAADESRKRGRILSLDYLRPGFVESREPAENRRSDPRFAHIRGSDFSTPTVATPAGQIGKTVAVAPPPGWPPKFVSPDAYRPMQDKIRAGMRENLLKLVAQPS